MSVATDEEVQAEESRDPVSLGEAAAAAFGEGEQAEFDETESTKVKFVGMQYDAFEENIRIGDEMVFTVRARCIGSGDEYMKTSGNIRHVVKMDVLSVLPEGKS